MSDVTHATKIQGDSPEAVAYALLLGIALSENKTAVGGVIPSADKKWLLRTYAHCLEAVRNSGSIEGEIAEWAD